MKRISILAAALAATLAVSVPAFAKDTETKSQPNGETSQQNRMKVCNAQAAEKNLKGDERKAFMSACLKGQKTN